MATFYHVTDRKNVQQIQKDGFIGDWGDDGFGVYLFSDFGAADDYASHNGWDGGLSDPVILEIEASSDLVDAVIPHPDWPDPDKYEEVRIFRMDGNEPRGVETWHVEFYVLDDDNPGISA